MVTMSEDVMLFEEIQEVDVHTCTELDEMVDTHLAMELMDRMHFQHQLVWLRYSQAGLGHIGKVLHLGGLGTCSLVTLVLLV